MIAAAAQARAGLDQFKNTRQGGTVTSARDVEQTLRDAGLRVTRPRLAVLEAVRSHPHASTDALIHAVRAGMPGVSHQAVYDVLRVLTAARLVRRIEPAGSVARYEARVGDNHHHAVCRACGAIADVDCVVGSAPCLTGPVTPDGALSTFVVDEAEVVLWGTCGACSARTDT